MSPSKQLLRERYSVVPTLSLIWKSRRGQFIPIACMVMLTAVVFMVAAVNVYRVAQAKLKVQNIADAVALDIAAREVASINNVADQDEWLNRLYANSTTPDPHNPCPNIAHSPVLPGISCVEWQGSLSNSYRFTSQPGATAYARLVKTVNDSQALMYNAYNTFIGAGAGGQKSLQEILQADIKDLEQDPSLLIVPFNSQAGQQSAASQAQSIKASKPTASTMGSAGMVQTQNMQPLQYAVHDVKVAYQTVSLIKLGSPGTEQKTFSQLLNSNTPIGWMTLSDASPKMAVRDRKGQQQTRYGAGAYVYKTITVLGQPYIVSAMATAVLVPGSGTLPKDPRTQTGPSQPLFKPTFWVKLVSS